MKRTSPLWMVLPVVALGALLVAFGFRVDQASGSRWVFPSDFATRIKAVVAATADERPTGCSLVDVHAQPERCRFGFACPNQTSAVIEVLLQPGIDLQLQPSARGTAPREVLQSLASKIRGAISESMLVRLPGPGPDKGPLSLLASERSLGVEAMHLLLLWGFLAFWLSGRLGWSGWAPIDRWVWIPVGLGACARLLLAQHGNLELNLHFFDPHPAGFFSDKHSLVYAALKQPFGWLGHHAQPALMSFNACLGALTVLPVYRLVLLRFEDRTAAFLAALCFALHPELVRVAPTDGHYAALLFFLFSGLAYLAGPALSRRDVVAGIVFLSLAAVSRIDGLTHVGIGLLLLRWRPFWICLKSSPWLLLTFVPTLALCLSQAILKLPVWRGEQRVYLPHASLEWLGGWLREGAAACTRLFFSSSGQDPLLLGLCWIGLLGGVRLAVLRRSWILFAAAWLSVWAMRTPHPFPLTAHRWVPGIAFLCLGCGLVLGWALSLVHAVPVRRKALVGVTLALAAWLVAFHLDRLQTSYAFNTEYQLLRTHLGRKNLAGRDCHLLFVEGVMDSGLRSFPIVLPELTLHNCLAEDCSEQTGQTGCVYYFRGGACFLTHHPSGRNGLTTRALCQRLENQLALQPVEERWVDFAGSYGASSEQMIPAGLVGLYRVDRRTSSMSPK